MIDYFENLTENEKEVLISAPVYAALMGALEDGKISHAEEKDATNLAHLRTFTSAPILHGYYQEVEKSFKEKMQSLIGSLPSDAEESRKLIHNELDKIQSITTKLDIGFAKELYKSLRSFSKHVSREKDVT
ncbi:MAG: hypothetical protein ACR2MX_11930, partial [Cyclobacteriaceae bacterium]